MEQYRFDPYTGQPLMSQSRPAAARTWLGNGQPGPVYPAQYQQGQGGQPNQPGIIVRPVASYDEAKAVPTDFSGALTVMPDWGHGYIYVKALGDNGIPVLGIYHDINAAKNSTPLPAAEPAPAAPVPIPEGIYAPLETVECLRCEVEKLRKELDALRPQAKETAEKPAGKGSKA